MIIASNDIQEVPIQQGTLYTIEIMLIGYLLTPNERFRFESEMIAAKYEYEGQEILERLQSFRPIMGLHNWPLNIEQTGEAIKYQVAKDDLHEERWTKRNTAKR